MTAPEDRFLSTEEVADKLQVDEQTIRRWIKSGKLEAFKPGREWRIPPAALEALLGSYSSPKAQAPRSLGRSREEEEETIYALHLLAQRASALSRSWDEEAQRRISEADFPRQRSTEMQLAATGLASLFDEYYERYLTSETDAATRDKLTWFKKVVAEMVETVERIAIAAQAVRTASSATHSSEEDEAASSLVQRHLKAVDSRLSA